MKTGSKKSGISLIVLLITIVVALIILSASTIKILDSSDNATIASFAEELKAMEDSAKEYYLQNNDLPIIDSDKGFPKTKEDILNLNSESVGNPDRKSLAGEIDSNFDNSENTVFYRLDLAKINVSSTTRGVQKKGNEKDIYVIAYPSFRIYYIEGVQAKNTKFFSLSSKISGVYVGNLNIENYINETTSSENVSKLTVKRNVNDYSNKMGVIINTTINDVNSEKIYVKLGNASEKLIAATVRGFNTINIESDNFSLTELQQFQALNEEERVLEVIKKKNDLEVDKVKVDLSKYDTSAPFLVQNTISMKENSSTNTLYFDISDALVINNVVSEKGASSGVKEVRYEYLKKLNMNKGQIENYYSNSSNFSDSYMKSEAKKAEISNSGTVKIEVPSDVSTIKICVIDNAGNYTIYDQNIATNVSVGYKINSVNTRYLDIDVYIYSGYIVNSGTVSISTDGGINYDNIRYFNEVPNYSMRDMRLVFDNVATFDKFVYLKAIFKNGSGEEETKIIKIDLNM